MHSNPMQGVPASLKQENYIGTAWNVRNWLQGEGVYMYSNPMQGVPYFLKQGNPEEQSWTLETDYTVKTE